MEGCTQTDDVQEDAPMSLMIIEAPPEAVNSRKARRISARRSRPFTEKLLINEGLRQNLIDEQAQRLIGWATERLEEMAIDSADLEDTAAERLLQTLSKGVTDVIRQIDHVMGNELDEVADEFRAIAVDSAESDKDTLFEKLFAFATKPQTTIATTDAPSTMSEITD